MSGGKDKRRYFRVDTSIFLHYREVSDIDLERGLTELAAGGGGEAGLAASLLKTEAKIQDAIVSLKQRSPELASVLTLINNKVNALNNTMALLEDSDWKVKTQKPVDVNISASGIAFPSEEMLLEGAKLCLRMVLPPSYHYIITFASVVRCINNPAGDPPYLIAAEFLSLTPRDKDRLIKHTLQRDSETLRLRRLKMQDAK